MEEHEIREVAQAAAREAVREFLIALGIDSTDPIKMQHQMSSLATLNDQMNDEDYQADQLHLREWRVAMENAKNVTFKVIVTTIIAGVVGFIVLGFNANYHK